MIDVAEHVYHDDPRIGPPDARTQLRDVCYYFLGNGLIQAAVQHAPGGEGTPYGLLLMNPQHLKMKREALSFDDTSGIASTMLSISFGETASPMEGCHINVRWDTDNGHPGVRIEWQTQALQVYELFCCPDRSTPRLLRKIRLHNSSSLPVRCSLQTGVRTQSIARSLDLPPDATRELHIVYALDDGGSAMSLAFADQHFSCMDSLQYWHETTQIQLASESLDHLFRSAAWQLPAATAGTGKVDAGIWQYNREWVRDQAFMAHALILCGHHQLGKVMLDRLLRDFISDEGSPTDSSEIRAHADAELDQNGALLHALQQYVLWTGDLGIVRSHWQRIVSTAEYPLRPVFREPASGLLCNQRDFWERHGVYGIEPGIELTYQVFVSIGLSSAAWLARRMERTPEADRWQAEADRLRCAVLHHPTHALVSETGFVKRRGIDGSIQEYIVPRPNHGLPEGVGLARNVPHPLNPDSASALPIVMGFVPPESDVALSTLEQLEMLWNQGWTTGGYGRYHMDSDPDSAGPWPFPSIFIARAYVERRQHAKVWRVIRWLAARPEYPSGAFFEMYGDRIAPPYAQNGIVPWTWAEIIMLVVKNLLGFQPEEEAMQVRPRLLPGLPLVKGSIPFRDSRIFFAFEQDDQIERSQFRINSRPVEANGEFLYVPYARGNVYIEGRIPPLPRTL